MSGNTPAEAATAIDVRHSTDHAVVQAPGTSNSDTGDSPQELPSTDVHELSSIASLWGSPRTRTCFPKRSIECDTSLLCVIWVSSCCVCCWCDCWKERAHPADPCNYRKPGSTAEESPEGPSLSSGVFGISLIGSLENTRLGEGFGSLGYNQQWGPPSYADSNAEWNMENTAKHTLEEVRGGYSADSQIPRNLFGPLSVPQSSFSLHAGSAPSLEESWLGPDKVAPSLPNLLGKDLNAMLEGAGPEDFSTKIGSDETPGIPSNAMKRVQSDLNVTAAAFVPLNPQPAHSVVSGNQTEPAEIREPQVDVLPNSSSLEASDSPACSVCTFINTRDAKQCEMCGSPMSTTNYDSTWPQIGNGRSTKGSTNSLEYSYQQVHQNGNNHEQQVSSWPKLQSTKPESGSLGWTTVGTSLEIVRLLLCSFA